MVDLAAWRTPRIRTMRSCGRAKAHNGSVQGLAVSDSGLIATASSAGNIRVWDADGHLVADVPIKPDDPPSVSFAGGTDTLYYEDASGVVRRFLLDPIRSMALARSLVHRSLTPDECTRYFPDGHCPNRPLNGR